ncbi:GntR family transcriptional regulator [Fuscibacter oryzae]|uniref:GntR family transcriptional regulator n=1 Tax=Fuscibacter oryzae TaxID=2803939 RepID=A0A8J7SW91_9RHOB|nr:GntR family transcriptional regulator [Fuscibacter oryzae]MBL4929431.1 GntR family transcriptional regulator [Fuscibacter oryzae]
MDEAEETEIVRGPRGSSASTTYETLRHEILTMVLRPGEVLDEVSLSKRFGMSRSPIREAIVRLSGEGLVTVLPNRSTIVSNLDIGMLPAFLDALELTQRAVTRLAATHRTATDLEKIRTYQGKFAEYQAASNLSEMLAANYEYHMAIAEAGRNKYFAMLYGRLLDEGKRLMHMNYSFEIMPQGDGRASLADEHAEITAAIEARDADRAERLGYEHAVLFRKRVLRHVMSSELADVTVKSSG